MNRDVQPLPGYQEPYGLLAAILQDGTQEWRAELPAELDAEATIWQPAPGMHSIGGIMLHIAAVEVLWIESFLLRLPMDPAERKLLMIDETDVDEYRWPNPPKQPLTWFYAVHDKIRTRILESIKRLPPAETIISDHEDNLTPRWVLGHVIQHEAYHGGQAVLLHLLRTLTDGAS